jgi:AraC-like DNA-binding protein
MVDTHVLTAASVAIGKFRCPVRYASFRDTGPIERHIVVFPRTGVWIRHEGSQRFLAEPTIVTIYNQGQRYERFAASADGDRCDWFAVSEVLAREIVSRHDGEAAESDRPFRYEWAPSDAHAYVTQRALLNRAMRQTLDLLEAEERVIDLVARVLARAYAAHAAVRVVPNATIARHRDLTERAKAELLRTISANRSVQDIAAAVGASPYHLCRVFRSVTGTTMHEYRNELRVRLALEMFDGAASLSAVAHDVGFSSHAHLVTALRRHAGITPSAARSLVRVDA